MRPGLADALARLTQTGARIEDAMRDAAGVPERSARLAGMLRDLWPSLPLHSCLLCRAQDPALTVLDASGRARPDWARDLREPLLALAKEDGGGAVQRFEPPAAVRATAPSVVAARAVHGGSCRAVLAAGLPGDVSAEEAATVGSLLRIAADQLGLRLDAAERRQELEALREELAVERWLATQGELARPVTHDFNNFLNVILLQVAVLEMELSPALRAELGEIRKQGNAVASLVRQFQRHRQQAPAPGPVDLNRAVREAAAQLAPGGIRPGLDLAPDLPPVSATPPELRRLCHFLFASARAVVDPTAGVVIVRTQATSGRVVARFEDNGPPIPAERLTHAFDPHMPAREGTSGLELAACRTMARRLRGNLSAENLQGGGVALILDLPAAGA
jgi:signal transduction histidine kinase